MSTLSELLPSGGGSDVADFVASGTLPNGQAVVLKSDGTVEVVGESSTSVAESIPAGSEAVFNSTGNSDWNSVAFDPNNAGRFVVAYRDDTLTYGTAIVGTVSGTSISFGAEYIFRSGRADYNSIAFDPNTAGKFVIAYRDVDPVAYGKAVVGTVSGTTISFGSAYIFNAQDTEFTSISFDPSTSGKFVVAYQDAGNSSYGTATVGTVSGTTLSFGAEVVFNAARSDAVSCSFDPNNAGKFVVAYMDDANSVYGTTRYFYKLWEYGCI